MGPSRIAGATGASWSTASSPPPPPGASVQLPSPHLGCVDLKTVNDGTGEFASVHRALRYWVLSLLLAWAVCCLPVAPFPTLPPPGPTMKKVKSYSPCTVGQPFLTPPNLCTHSPLCSTQQNRAEISCLQVCLPHSATNPLKAGLGYVLFTLEYPALGTVLAQFCEHSGARRPTFKS